MALTLSAKLSVIILFIFLAVADGARSWAYTRIATQTPNNRACMNKCENNHCSYLIYSQSCVDTGKPAPRYHTAMTNKQGIEFCLSNCDKFGESYEWCYIDENENWDYCSTKTEIKTVERYQLRNSIILCRGECKNDYYLEDYVCSNYYTRVLEPCKPQIISFNVSQTVYKQDCFTPCDKHNGYTYYWCYTDFQEWQYCALPAEPRT